MELETSLESPSLLYWIVGNTDLFEYQNSISYNKEDIVTMGKSAYQSLTDNNLNNYPPNSSKWIKLA